MSRLKIYGIAYYKTREIILLQLLEPHQAHTMLDLLPTLLSLHFLITAALFVINIDEHHSIAWSLLHLEFYFAATSKRITLIGLQSLEDHMLYLLEGIELTVVHAQHPTHYIKAFPCCMLVTTPLHSNICMPPYMLLNRL